MLVIAAPASAHDDEPTLTNLTPVELANQQALQAALAGNAPTDTEHAAEHESLAAAEGRFDALPAARQAQIRSGAAAARAADAPPVDDAATVGAWTEAPFAAPSYAINMVLLPTGKVLVFSMGSSHANCQERCAAGDLGNAGVNVNNDGTAAVWDPAKGYGEDAFKILPPPNVDLSGYDLTDVRADPTVKAGNAANPYLNQGSATARPAPIFCSGQVQTADGRVLIAGGNLEARGNAYGLKMAFLFDPFTERWTREPDLQHARWYPTLTRLPSGRVAILGGRDDHGKDVASIELYPEQAAPVPGVNGAAGATGLRTTSLYDDASDPANPLGQKTGADGSSYSAGLGYYPFSMVLPNGQLSISRWQSGNLGLLTPGTGAFGYLGGPTYKSALGKYASAFPAPGDENGTSEMVMAGGLAINPDYSASTTLLSSVWSIKPAEAAANGTDWQAQPSLNTARRNASATLLPDGTAVVVGGGDSNDRIPYADIQNPENHQQRHVELWDPITRNWTVGPAAVVPRGYHSTSVLLPDGRVLTGGDDWVSYVLDPDHTDAYDSTFEIYSPPYLFKGDRPVVDELPGRIDYGGMFDVRGSSTGGHTITRATLVAPGSMTHAFDSNQRVLELPVVAGDDGTVHVTAPTSANAAPPGDYMLFLLDERGVPSVGKFLRVAAEHADGEYPTDPRANEPDPAPTPAAAPTAAPVPVPAGNGATSQPGGTPTTASPAGRPTPITVPGPSPTSKAPIAKAKPELALSGRRLTFAATLRPTGKRCPTRVTATTTVSGRKTTKRLTVRAATVAGTRACRLTGTITLPRAPSAKARVTATVSGTGIKRRVVRAVRA